MESVFIDDIQANLDTAAELGFETILSNKRDREYQSYGDFAGYEREV